jgi:hypothetical protein
MNLPKGGFLVYCFYFAFSSLIQEERFKLNLYQEFKSAEEMGVRHAE